ncbi:hypothetical protein ACJX0J_028102, partial [Zea mays]
SILVGRAKRDISCAGDIDCSKNGTWDIVFLPKENKIPPRQIPGIDYNDVFSLVVKQSSICTFLSITTFLHGELDKEIYMDQPEDFMVPGKNNFRFGSFMISNGFKRSQYDSC